MSLPCSRSEAPALGDERSEGVNLEGRGGGERAAEEMAEPSVAAPAKAAEERRRHQRGDLVPLAALISREMKNEKMERPCIRYGCAAQSRKGEDYFLIKVDCHRLPGNPSSAFSVFAVSIMSPRLLLTIDLLFSIFSAQITFLMVFVWLLANRILFVLLVLLSF